MVLYHRLSQTRLHEHVVEQVLEGIVGGATPPGSTLPTEPEMGRRFGVSRVVVREAVRVLSEKGLVEVRHGFGTLVNPPERWSQLDPLVMMARLRTGSLVGILDNLLEARKMTEIEAAGLAARHVNPEDRENLTGLIEAMAHVLDQPARYTEVDNDFHDALVEATHNLLLKSMISPFAPVFREGRRMNAQLLWTIGESYAGHLAILNAVARRDEAGARAAMDRHIAQFERDMHVTLARITGNQAPDPGQA